MKANLGYFTIPVADVARGQKFYGGLFDWHFAGGADDRYAHVDNTDPPGGLHKAEPSVPQVWFRIDDIQAGVKRVRELGGHAEEPSQSPSGWSSACRDDQGSQFNLWQPAAGY